MERNATNIFRDAWSLTYEQQRRRDSTSCKDNMPSALIQRTAFTAAPLFNVLLIPCKAFGNGWHYFNTLIFKSQTDHTPRIPREIMAAAANINISFMNNFKR